MVLSRTPPALETLLCPPSPSQFTLLPWCHWSKNKGVILESFKFYPISHLSLGLVVPLPKHGWNWPQPSHQFPAWAGASCVHSGQPTALPEPPKLVFSPLAVPTGCSRVNPDSLSWSVRAVLFDPLPVCPIRWDASHSGSPLPHPASVSLSAFLLFCVLFLCPNALLLVISLIAAASSSSSWSPALGQPPPYTSTPHAPPMCYSPEVLTCTCFLLAAFRAGLVFPPRCTAPCVFIAVFHLVSAEGAKALHEAQCSGMLGVTFESALALLPRSLLWPPEPAGCFTGSQPLLAWEPLETSRNYMRK